MAKYSFVDDEPAPGKGYSFVDDVPAQTPTAGSRARAGAAGINKGFFADLLGLPVDTVANVLDLGKAGFGTAASALGRPDLAPDLGDRRGTIGSSEWIARKINDVGLGGAINNPNPDDAASRILHTGGRVAGASIVPNPRAALSLPQNLANMGKGAVGGVAAGSMGEVAPEWAGLAGMLPQAGMSAGAAALKRGVRGGESGRMAMERRIQDLKNGGVESPSVGLASGNRGVMGIENLLSQTPGSVGIYEAARSKNVAGMKAKSDQLRDSLSPEYGPLVAGEAIQGSIKKPFIERFKKNQSKLYDAVDAMIPGASKAEVQNTAEALTRLTASIEGAPNIGSRFINGRIADINDGFRLDAGLDIKPGSRTITSRTPVDPGTNPRNYPGEGAPRMQGARPPTASSRTINPNVSVSGEGAWRPSAAPELPYQAIAKLRSQVGKELDSNMLMSDVPRSQWKQLYGSLSEDIGGAAANQGPGATQAWERANTYTKRGIGRIEDLESLANRSTPEGAYNAVASSLTSGPTVYKRLRGALTNDARRKVVSTIVDELGAAPAGQQGADGDAWSPRTFLTNYNKIDSGARQEMFKRIPGGAGMSGNLAEIAKTADMISEASKNWANPSGTAPALVARGTIGTIAAGAVGGIFYAPLIAPAATAAGGLMVANQVSKRLLLNPVFVNWLAKAPQVSPDSAQAYAQRLIANANMTNDKQFTQDVSEYLRSVEQGKEEE